MSREPGRVLRLPCTRLLVESVEYVLDCLKHGVGTAEVEGHVSDVFDESVLAMRKESAHAV